jgi:hypothetical protein
VGLGNGSFVGDGHWEVEPVVVSPLKIDGVEYCFL